MGRSRARQAEGRRWDRRRGFFLLLLQERVAGYGCGALWSLNGNDGRAGPMLHRSR